MVLIALVLIAAGVAVAIGLLAGGNTDAVTVTVFDRVLPETTVLAVFAGGAAAMFLMGVGVSILRATARRSMERRREIQALEDEHEDRMRRLEDENARLQRQLGDTRPGLPRGGLSADGLAATPPETHASGYPVTGSQPPVSPVRNPNDPWADLRGDTDGYPHRPSSTFGRH
ncbi:MAG: hypothetical protein ACRDYU_14640 [Actinomycetes bacterium]